MNIFRSQLLAGINNVSVWWHVFGAAAVILILVLPARCHQSSWVFTQTLNNSGPTVREGAVLGDPRAAPRGLKMTQYTVTGYDALGTCRRRPTGRGRGRPGIWQSIFYSAIGGWVLLLSFLFAVQDEAAVTARRAAALAAIFAQALISKRVGRRRARHRCHRPVLLLDGLR